MAATSQVTNEYLVGFYGVWAVAVLMGAKGIYALYWRVYKDKSDTEE
jgi:hypothetical protein